MTGQGTEHGSRQCAADDSVAYFYRVRYSYGA